MTNTNTKLYIANLGKYNEGILQGEWINLPFTEEELENLMVKIQVATKNENGEFVPCYEEDGICYEEYAIHDYETECKELKIGEYSSLTDLNEKVEQLENMDECEYNALRAYLDNGYEFTDALEHVEDGDYMYYSDCSNMSEVAEQYADETGLLDSIPENLRSYFDFEAYGRDMSFEGTFIFIDNDCIQLY